MKILSTLLLSTITMIHAEIVLISFGDILIPIKIQEKTVLLEGEIILDQEKLLKLVNDARTAGYVCGSTFYSPTNTVVWNIQIESAARIHSDDMYRNNFFSHTGSDTSSAGDRLERVGYSWRTYGENIAGGYTSEESVMLGWLNSAGHCSNIMNPAFTEMGISRVGSYWTHDFADTF